MDRRRPAPRLPDADRGRGKGYDPTGGYGDVSEGKAPWTVSAEGLAAELSTREGGLGGPEAAERLRREGPNELPEEPRRPLWLQLLDQVTHFLAVLLWVAGALAFVSRTPELGWAIWAVIVVNAAFSFWQERKAERALQILQQAMPADARVWRDGHVRVLPARDLVPGDLVELAEGDRVSADARLLSADFLRVDLSLLTGESVPVERAPGTAPETTAVEAKNVVLAGSSVVAGRARALVYATGRRTELGKVAHLTAGVEREPSTLSVQVAALVRLITLLSVGIGVAVFALGRLLVGLELGEGAIFAIGMIVANVPEGLLPTVTLALAMGVQRMARRRVLVRRMPAIETLSAVTVICTDKTGTLTRNEMSVRELWLPGGEIALARAPDGWLARGAGGGGQARLAVACGAICTEASAVPEPGAEQAVVREPMEAALLAAARRAGVDPTGLFRSSPRVRELPFDTARRMMTVVVRWGAPALWEARQPLLALTKGAPLEVLACCDRLLDGGASKALGDAERAEIRAATDRLAARGHRVLALAFREDGEILSRGGAAEVERGLVFLGLVGIIDPPRPGVEAAVAACRRAGIRVAMVTGDYGLTAEAIAREVGLIEGPATVVSGAEMAALGDGALQDLLRTRTGLVFARVMPEQKLRLVKAFRALGEVVAVTGDGVNDAPALRAAHVGIAMGRSGTDVARAAADLVLLDDDFSAIVSAVEEGRAIYQNIRKFLAYILTSNVPELAPFLCMVALRIPPALNILQILAVDLGTDMVPALALGGERPEPGLMERPPRPRHSSLLDRSLLLRAYLRLGLVQAATSMLAFFAVLRLGGVGLDDLRRLTTAIVSHVASPEALALYRTATTATLATIVASQMGNLLACRSELLSAFRAGFFSNRLVFVGLAVEGAIIAGIVYLPVLQGVFRTEALPALAWVAMLAGPASLLAVDETLKAVRRRSGA